MQLLTLYLNFVVKLVDIGFKVLIWALTMTGKALVAIVSALYERQAHRPGNRIRRRRWKRR